MSMDMAAAGSKVLAGSGGGTGPDDPFLQEVITTTAGADVPLGYNRITNLPLLNPQNLPGIPAGATWAVIVIEGADVRWRDDGVVPTSTIGMPLAQGSTMTYRGNLAAIQFIQQTGGAVLNVSYYQ